MVRCSSGQKSLVLKTCVLSKARGFESHPYRQWRIDRYGLLCLFAKQVCVKAVRVRISCSPHFGIALGSWTVCKTQPCCSSILPYPTFGFYVKFPYIRYMNKLKYVTIGFILAVCWASISSIVLVHFGYNDIPREVPEETIPFFFFFFIACIWAPIWEEMTYRWAPIEIAKRQAPNILYPVIILSSAYFGWGHGECQEGVFIQGVLGLIFSWVYLKTNNILYNMLLHMAYNSFILFAPVLAN